MRAVFRNRLALVKHHFTPRLTVFDGDPSVLFSTNRDRPRTCFTSSPDLLSLLSLALSHRPGSALDNPNSTIALLCVSVRYALFKFNNRPNRAVRPETGKSWCNIDSCTTSQPQHRAESRCRCPSLLVDDILHTGEPCLTTKRHEE